MEIDREGDEGKEEGLKKESQVTFQIWLLNGT